MGSEKQSTAPLPPVEGGLCAHRSATAQFAPRDWKIDGKDVDVFSAAGRCGRRLPSRSVPATQSLQPKHKETRRGRTVKVRVIIKF